MTRKLLFVAFVLALALTFVAARHQLTNASPNVAPPPKHAPPLEQMAALASGESNWQVVAGGGGKDLRLHDVSMASSSEGWAVGGAGPSSYGVIMHYTNTTWSRTAIPSGTYGIQAISMISPTEGWAAGVVACSYGCDQGLLMHYTASTGWQTTTLPAKPSGNWGGFLGMDIKGTTGWIVGYDWSGNNYFPSFGGTTWTSVQAPSGVVGYPDVSVVDVNEAWAVGGSNGWYGGDKLAHFAGGSWSIVTPIVPSGTYLEAVHVITHSLGWAVGYVRSGTSPNYSYSCLTLHYDGVNWSEWACPSSASNARLYSVRIRTANDVWAVGSGPSTASSGVILHYDGSAWTQVAVPPGTPRLESVRLVGTDEGWAVGQGGAILRLVGGNWTRVQGPSLTVGPLDSVSANQAWFGGDAGQLYQWQNGTIVTHTSPRATPLTALDMVSSTLGWAATDQPVPSILRYSEGAWTTWPLTSVISSISMVGPEEGWFAIRAASSAGSLLYYNSGVWQQQSVPGGSRVNSVSMLDSSYGWATGYGGIGWKQVYQYSSGTWSAVSPALNLTGEYGNLKIIAINSGEAWVAGWSQVLSSSSDVPSPARPELYHFSGGAWTKANTPDWLAFLGISKVSATEWWAAGKRTTGEYAFLHYKDGTYATVPAAGEDVIGVSMLPDGSGFARGVGSLLKLVFPVTTTVDSGTPATIVFTGTQATTTTVSIPAGAVITTTIIQYTPVYSVTDPPSGYGLAGHAFDLDAYQGGTLVPSFVFSKPVTITIHYSDGDVAGLDENMLTLLYWNGSAWASDGISVVERNPAQNYIVVTITHLSEFALFEGVTPQQVAGVSLVANENGAVYPGQSLAYQHTLTNTGTGSDSFTMTASIDRPGWSVAVAPSVVGPLASGESSGVVVTVTASSNITATVMATASVTATSQFDASMTSVVVDVTTGQPYQVYLPIVLRQ